MSNPLIHYDSISDTLHLELSPRQGRVSIVHYIDHPHVALLLNEKTRQTIGFHIEAVSEFIKPGLIGKLEMLKELARDETLSAMSKCIVLGGIVDPPGPPTDKQMAEIVARSKTLEKEARVRQAQWEATAEDDATIQQHMDTLDN